MNEVTTVINNRIKERGTTLVHVSKRAGMKLDILSKTLNGNRKLKADELISLCQVLDLTLDDFRPMPN